MVFFVKLGFEFTDVTEEKMAYFHMIFNSVKFEYFPKKGVFANNYKLRGKIVILLKYV